VSLGFQLMASSLRLAARELISSREALAADSTSLTLLHNGLQAGLKPASTQMAQGRAEGHSPSCELSAISSWLIALEIGAGG